MNIYQCPNCKARISATDRFCNNCGLRLDNFPPASADKDDNDTNIVDDTVAPSDNGTNIVDDTSVLSDNDTNIIDDTGILYNSSAADTAATSGIDVSDSDAENFHADAEELEDAGDAEDFDDVPPSKSRRWWIIPLILVLLLVAAGVVYYFGFRSNEKLNAENKTETENSAEQNGTDNNENDVKIIEEKKAGEPDMSVTPDRVFNDVHGPVRSLSTSDGTISFDALGNMNSDSPIHYKRNAQGYIVATEYDNGDSMIETVFDFDGSKYTRMEMTRDDYREIHTFTYNSDGLLTSAKITNPSMPNIYIIYDFSNYIFDNHHNWISRKRSGRRVYNDEYGNHQDTSEDIQSRSISYYE